MRRIGQVRYMYMIWYSVDVRKHSWVCNLTMYIHVCLQHVYTSSLHKVLFYTCIGCVDQGNKGVFAGNLTNLLPNLRMIHFSPCTYLGCLLFAQPALYVYVCVFACV